jgi:hypothetical protein
MGKRSKLSNSGEGTRPTSSSEVDNIGGAGSLSPDGTPKANNTAPRPAEEMTEKRQDKTFTRENYPAPYNID